MTSGERDPCIKLLAIGLDAFKKDAALSGFSRLREGRSQVIFIFKRLAIRAQQHGSVSNAFVGPIAWPNVCHNKPPPKVQASLGRLVCGFKPDAPVGREAFFVHRPGLCKCYGAF